MHSYKVTGNFTETYEPSLKCMRSTLSTWKHRYAKYK